MDLNDFLIHSNALNIRLSGNLITQSIGDRFCEYINKWQLLEALPFLLDWNMFINLLVHFALTHFVINATLFNNCRVYNKTVAFCNKNYVAFCLKLLSHSVIKWLSYFVIISVAICSKVSWWTKYETVDTVDSQNFLDFLMSRTYTIFMLYSMSLSPSYLEGGCITVSLLERKLQNGLEFLLEIWRLELP